MAAQADSQCFQSLPAKAQQQFFSPEEQLRLRRAYRYSVVLDAADQAFYRRDPKRHGRPSTDSDTTLPACQPCAVFGGSSEDEDEPDPKMDQSLYDSFRCLDEDGDLDLSLDEYHAHVADSATKPRRRGPSFRHSLSIRNSWIGKPALSTTRALPAPSPLTQANRRSTSRPPTHNRHISHAPRSSTSSIDPAAQYYQDPDARLKLRVYLASPQKFDEAIEFGFPALQENHQQGNPDKENVNKKKNVVPEPKPSNSPKLILAPQDFGTFFEDNDGSIVGGASEPVVEHPAQEGTPAADSPSLQKQRRSSLQESKPGLQRLPGNREMTLKMTLTRPDLRTESPTESSSPKDDPLRLAELPPADRRQTIWDTDRDEQGVVKKMWRKLRRRG